MQKRTGFSVGLGTALGLLSTMAQAAPLTPPQIVQRCQAAYDALQTYQGTTTVTTLGNGGRQTYHTSAQIVFARPGKIRAWGDAMFGGQFAYVSDGTTTMQKMGGTWQSAKDAETAIAGATGVAQNAATTLPALLLHTRWGDPFPRGLAFQAVRQEAIGGHPCYRVSGTSAMGSDTYWIDTKTFLLRRLVSDFAGGGFQLHHDETFSGERLNAPIPATTFALPAGH